VSSVPSTSRE
jgi:hypothetical protein